MEHGTWKEVDADLTALARKSLSNYSRLFDVFRELIQNADDANAKNIEIHFLTETSEGADMDKWVIRDDGDGLVSEAQWERLCTIAKGNDVSGKVGTFGVGFFTVLSVCDEPLLRSKGKSAQFSLRDKFRVKREQCETDNWTTIVLALKKDLEERRPHLPDLARFLISSITFLENVNTITVSPAGPETLRIQKNLEPCTPIEIPASSSSREGDAIQSIDSATQRVSVHAKGEVFRTQPAEKIDNDNDFELSPTSNQTTTSEPSETEMEWNVEVAYCLYTAQMDLSHKAGEAVKMFVKDPSGHISCKAVYFTAEQQKLVEESPLRHLFDGEDGIFPQCNSGHIFIGQTTRERTGIALHVGNKYIVPDMERSSVRFDGGTVEKWNKLLLNIAGYLARAIYEQQMKTARTLGREKLEELGLNTMRRFVFDQYAAGGTSSHLKTGFFSAPNQSILSDSGISDVSLLRRHNKSLHPIFRNFRYLHSELSAEHRRLIEAQAKISNINDRDAVQEFSSGCLSEGEIVEFFNWAEGAVKNGTLKLTEKQKNVLFEELRRQGQFVRQDCGNIGLKNIKHYTHLAPYYELLPLDTIYIKEVQNDANYFGLFGWEELDPVIWSKHVCKRDDEKRKVGPRDLLENHVLSALTGPHGIPITSLERWAEVARHLNIYTTDMAGIGFKELEGVENVPFILFPEDHLLANTPQCLQDCFLKSSLPKDKSYLENALPFVELDDDGTVPITKIGPPKASDIACAMVAHPHGFLDLAGVDGYLDNLRDIAKQFDSFGEELKERMRESPVLLGKRKQDEYEPRKGCEIWIGGDAENLSDFCRSVFVVPDGLKTFYKKLGSEPLDGLVKYSVRYGDMDDILPSESIPSGDDILRCVKVFIAGDLDREWRSDLSTYKFLLRTCRKLQLEKDLYPSPGVVSETSTPSREVAAGLEMSSDAPITVWISRDHDLKNIYTDIATALCRELLKTYSQNDVLAMRTLLMDEESREVRRAPDSDSAKPTTPTPVNDVESEVSKGSPIDHSNDRSSTPPPSSPPSAARPTSEQRKRTLVTVLKDWRKTVARPWKGFRWLVEVLPAGYERKDDHCSRVDGALLEEDEGLKKEKITFFWADVSKESQRSGKAKDVVETFALQVKRLAGVFGFADPEKKFCIFWKDNCELAAFNHYEEGRIYLNLAHYYRHHHGTPDKERVIMAWYFLFAHELAHENGLHYHDPAHEQAFAKLCVSHLETLRASFKEHPKLGSNW